MEPASHASVNDDGLALAAERIFDGRRWHHHAAVLIERGYVRAVAPRGEVAEHWPCEVMPAGTMLAPGFIDLQVNGGGGILLNDDPTPEAMLTIARAHLRFGTTGCLPTLITDGLATCKAAIAAARTAAGEGGILGLHLEGPFISPARPGVHPPDRIAKARHADLDWLTALASAGTSLVTLAPECVPSGFVRELVRAGIRVSAGHSEASSAIVLQAMADGLSGVTHLHNAMPPMASREPGLVGAALSEPRLVAGLIVDGLHVDPLVVRASFAAKGSGGIALVSDAMPTVGTTAKEFELFGRKVKLHDGRLTTDAGTLAGAHLTMAGAVRTAVTQAGITLEDALRSATLTPARFLGIETQRGTLQVGSRADIVAMNSACEVVGTWSAGEAIDCDGVSPRVRTA